MTTGMDRLAQRVAGTPTRHADRRVWAFDEAADELIALFGAESIIARTRAQQILTGLRGILTKGEKP